MRTRRKLVLTALLLTAFCLSLFPVAVNAEPTIGEIITAGTTYDASEIDKTEDRTFMNQYSNWPEIILGFFGSSDADYSAGHYVYSNFINMGDVHKANSEITSFAVGYFTKDGSQFKISEISGPNFLIAYGQSPKKLLKDDWYGFNYFEDDYDETLSTLKLYFLNNENKIINQSTLLPDVTPSTTGRVKLVFEMPNGGQPKKEFIKTTYNPDNKTYTIKSGENTTITAPALGENEVYKVREQNAIPVNANNIVQVPTNREYYIDTIWHYDRVETTSDDVGELVINFTYPQSGVSILQTTIVTEKSETGYMVPESTPDINPDPNESFKSLYFWPKEPADNLPPHLQDGLLKIAGYDGLDSHVTWTYELGRQQAQSKLTVLFKDGGQTIDSQEIKTFQINSSDELFYIDPKIQSIKAPEITEEGRKWIPKEGSKVPAVEVESNSIDLTNFSDQLQKNTIWEYVLEGEAEPETSTLTIRLKMFGNLLPESEDSTVVVDTVKNLKTGKFEIPQDESDDTNNLRKLPINPGPSQAWYAENPAPSAIRKGNDFYVRVGGVSHLDADAEWFYDQRNMPSDKLTINFIDENGETVKQQEVSTYQYPNETTFSVSWAEEDISAPEQLSDGYKWISEGNQAPDVNAENNLVIKDIAGLKANETWNYVKKHVGEDGSPIIDYTVETDSGRVALTEVTVAGKQLTEKLKATLEENHGENSELILVLNELENFDLPITNEALISGRDNYYYEIYFVLVKDDVKTRVENVKANVTVTVTAKADQNAKVYVANENADPGNTPTLTLEAVTPVKVRGENYAFPAPHFSFYVLSLAEPTVTPPAEPIEEEDTSSPSIEEPKTRGISYFPWLWNRNRKPEAKTAAKTTAEPQVKVDSASRPGTVVTTVPATGEDRLPTLSIFALLATAAILIVIKKQYR